MKTSEVRKSIYDFLRDELKVNITKKQHEELKKMLVENAKAENEANQATILALLNQVKKLEDRKAKKEESLQEQKSREYTCEKCNKKFTAKKNATEIKCFCGNTDLKKTVV